MQNDWQSPYKGDECPSDSHTEARVARGMTISDLAKRIEVSLNVCVKVRNGTLSPQPAVLDRMALVLDFPITFFSKPLPEVKVSEGTLFFRKNATETALARDVLDIKSGGEEAFIESPRHLNFPPLKLPDLRDLLTVEPYNLQDIQMIAKAVREQWGLGLAQFQTSPSF